LQEPGTGHRPQKPYLGAMGSNTTNEGKYQGFGNSPRMKEGIRAVVNVNVFLYHNFHYYLFFQNL
jgi:hypothetical protein